MASVQAWNYCNELVTDQTVCDECHGDLVDSKDPPSEVTIYTREGTKFAQHFHKECPNRWCRKTFFTVIQGLFLVLSKVILLK